MRKLAFIFLFAISFSLVTPSQAQELQSKTVGRQRVATDAYSLINEVNSLRAANGLPAYSINSILMSIAQQHAEFMSANGVSHFGYGGTRPSQRALNAGYPLAGDLSLGGFISENITAGSNKSVQQAVLEWQGDAPHLNTMLSANLREIGAGVVIVGDYVYYVIDCAAPTGSGQPQAYTAVPAGAPSGDSPTVVGPLIVNTLVPVTPLADGKLIHIVKPGETLWLIAVSYGVKIIDLRRLNNLAEQQDIYPGEKLLIGEVASSSPIPATSTATLQPTSTRVLTSTPTPPPLATTTQAPIASVSSDSSRLVLGIIVAAALLLTVVFVRAGRKI